MAEDIKAYVKPFLFPEHWPESGGFLPKDPAANACWYYCGLAMMRIEEFDKGRVLERDPEMEHNLQQIAWSIAKLYTLETPSAFLKYMRACRIEARRCALPWDSRIEDPKRPIFRKPRG